MTFYTSDERARMRAALERNDAAVRAYRMRERAGRSWLTCEKE